VKAVIQRVSSAEVRAEDRVAGAIGKGFLVLVGVEQGDAEGDALYLARKVAGLRIFEDGDGKMNLSLSQVGGAVLAVSQFTLCADTRKGNRPGFDRAARPEEGRRLYEAFVGALKEVGIPVETGVFGAHMEVTLTNDGPVTILMDSAGKAQRRASQPESGS